MTATAYLDAVGFVPASSGTGNFVVSTAIIGYQTPAAAGAVNATVYSYRAESNDKSQWEEGFGAYTVAGTTLARSTITANSSGGTTAISFTSAPNVYITAASADLQNASLLTSGTVAQARLGSGSAGAGGKALFDDQTYKAITAAGRLLARNTYFATATITPPTGATSAIIRMQAAGGGSGGNASSACGAYGGPGSGGAYLEAYIAVLSGNFTYTLGAPGAAGASGNNAGGAASASTLAMTGITTLSAPGGLGGGAGPAGAAAAGTANPTLNDATKDWGIPGSAAVIIQNSPSGVVAASILVGGASFRSAAPNFKNGGSALLYGGGAPGKGLVFSTAQAGTIGAVGMLEIEWYS